MNNYEILEAIRNGTHQEKYDEWLDHDDILIRATLAEMDYNPEKSIQELIGATSRTTKTSRLGISVSGKSGLYRRGQ